MNLFRTPSNLFEMRPSLFFFLVRRRTSSQYYCCVHCHLLTFNCFFQSKQGKYTYRSLSWSRAYRMIASGLHRFVLRQTMVSFHIINFLIKDHLSRGPGIQSRWRFPAAKAHLPVKRPFRRPGLLFRRRFCGQGPPSFKKTTVLLRFYKWPGSYPDEGFVANAHLPYE